MRHLISLLASVFVSNAVAAESTEQLEFKTIKMDGPFQVRQYDNYFTSQTTYKPKIGENSGDAFMRLFRYISGNNKAQESIEMTVPVTDQSSLEIEMTAPVTSVRGNEDVTMQFVLPRRFSEEEIPAPIDPRVKIAKVPRRKMATITFAGYDTEEPRLENEKRLRQWMKTQKNIEVLHGPIFAGYDSPEVPAEKRTNEVMFVIEIIN